MTHNVVLHVASILGVSGISPTETLRNINNKISSALADHSITIYNPLFSEHLSEEQKAHFNERNNQFCTDYQAYRTAALGRLKSFYNLVVPKLSDEVIYVLIHIYVNKLFIIFIVTQQREKVLQMINSLSPNCTPLSLFDVYNARPELIATSLQKVSANSSTIFFSGSVASAVVSDPNAYPTTTTTTTTTTKGKKKAQIKARQLERQQQNLANPNKTQSKVHQRRLERQQKRQDQATTGSALSKKEKAATKAQRKQERQLTKKERQREASTRIHEHPEHGQEEGAITHKVTPKDSDDDDEQENHSENTINTLMDNIEGSEEDARDYDEEEDIYYNDGDADSDDEGVEEGDHEANSEHDE